MDNIEKLTCAILEADNWKEIEDYAIEKGKYVNAAIVQAYTAELYLKGLLMYFEISWGKNTHNLKKLYDLLPDTLRKKIKKDTNIELNKNIKDGNNNFFPIVIKDVVTNNVIAEIKTFGCALEIIANNFVDLRYIFDKINNNKNTTVILQSFISAFKKTLKNVAYDIYNKKLKFI